MSEETQPTGAVEVFYSYAHEDEKLKEELLKHLANIERQGIIVSWHDRKITAGREWAGEINEHINTAGLILLLVSPDFMSSGYCNDVELKCAMERHEANEARVIPVILRPVDWKGAPFEKLQALPADARPVTSRKNRDAALLEVAQGIREAVEETAAQSAPQPSKKTNEPAIPRPPVVGFVARRNEQGRDIVALLSEELAPGKNHLVALWGPGGTGKTTLAAEVVRTTAKVFQGCVAWISALGRDDFNLATLLDGIATQLRREDLRRFAPEPKATQVAALVASRSTLVVLDNFETIAEEEQERCLDFLAQSAACPALITTRSLIDRDDVYNVPLAAMTMEEARDFLQRLVERTRRPSNFDLLDRDDLIRQCEANPLVLQWVVRQIDLAKRPQDVLSDLSQGEGDAAERVFARSFNLPQLGDDGRAALLALSLFTPDASREALAEVSGFGDDLRRLGKAVEGLSSLWLVEATAGNERLFLRGLTRELAKSELSKDERDEEFRQRYVEYFLHLAQAHKQPTPEDLGALDAEKDNVLSAIDVAFGLQEWVSVMLIQEALDEFLFLHGHWNEAIKNGEQAEIAARKVGDSRSTAYFISSVARIRYARAEYEDAGRGYREALEIFRKLRSEANVAGCLHQLGVIAREQSHFEEARRLCKNSLRIYKKLDDQGCVAISLHLLGNITYTQGNIDEAGRLYGESLEISRKFGNQYTVASTLHQLAMIAQAKGDIGEARHLYGESLEIERRLNNQNGIAITLYALGLLAEGEGKQAEAARLLHEALHILEKLGSLLASEAREALARVEGKPV
jgi:tetratricopeptide (TPR) repeat protein